MASYMRLSIRVRDVHVVSSGWSAVRKLKWLCSWQRSRTQQDDQWEGVLSRHDSFVNFQERAWRTEGRIQTRRLQDGCTEPCGPRPLDGWCNKPNLQFIVRIFRSVLDPILGPRVFDRLPLHVARIVSTAALERHDVIDNVSGTRAYSLAGGGTRACALERSSLRRITLDPTVAVSHTNGALHSRRSGVRANGAATGGVAICTGGSGECCSEGDQHAK